MKPRTEPRPAHFGVVFAHRPELKDLGWWMYEQRNRINARWQKSVLRVERKRRELYEGKEQHRPPDYD